MPYTINTVDVNDTKEKITLSEIQKEKAIAEEAIKDTLRNFNKKTGVLVRALEFNLVTGTLGFKADEVVLNYNVKLKVEL